MGFIKLYQCSWLVKAKRHGSDSVSCIADKVIYGTCSGCLKGYSPIISTIQYLCMYTGQVNWEFNYQAVELCPNLLPLWLPVGSAIITMMYESPWCPLLLASAPFCHHPSPYITTKSLMSCLTQLAFWYFLSAMY